MSRIVIDGLIACGKSSLLEQLHQNHGLVIRTEPVDDWYPILTKFYQDPQGWAFAMNLQVMATFSRWKHEPLKSTTFYERCPRSCKDVFTALSVEGGFMHPLQSDLFNELYPNLAWEPDVLIYLRATPEQCMARLQIRGRECESSVNLKYQQYLYDKYEAMVAGMQQRGTPVIIIDGNQSALEVYEATLVVLRQSGVI